MSQNNLNKKIFTKINRIVPKLINTLWDLLKDNNLMINNKLKERNILEDGKMVNSTEMEHILMKKVKKNKEYGKMVKKWNGFKND